jgi:hypothetical protein
MNEPLVFYAVRNKEGKFFRAKGYQGYGDTWVDSILKARIYMKMGQARSRITWFSENYPEYGVPDLIKITATQIESVDESERVGKQIRKKELHKIRQEEYEAQEDLQDAQRQLAEARDKLDKAKARLVK